MPRTLARLLLAASALVLATGGIMHARAFGKTVAAGSFIPAHMLAAASVAAVAGGLGTGAASSPRERA